MRPLVNMSLRNCIQSGILLPSLQSKSLQQITGHGKKNEKLKFADCGSMTILDFESFTTQWVTRPGSFQRTIKKETQFIHASPAEVPPATAPRTGRYSHPTQSSYPSSSSSANT